MSVDYLQSYCNKHGGCGCEGVSDCCFSCPLSKCRFDVRGGVRQIRNSERNPKIRAMQGVLPLSTVAKLFDMSPTNTRRIWQAPQMGVDSPIADVVA